MPTASTGALDPAVTKLDRSGHLIKRVIALLVMAVPGLGFLVALHLLWVGAFTTTDLVLFAAMYFVHMGGITMGFHRYLAHRSFKTSRTFEAILLISGSMAGQGPITFWVATHRRHHRYSDHDGDPHSPNLHGKGLLGRLRGLWWAHMPWMFSDDSARWSVFAPDIVRDRRLFYYHRTYPVWVLTGLALPAVAGFAVGHTPAAAFTGFIFGGLARMFLANQAAWAVGSLCHMWGGRPFENSDRSANNWPVAIATFGEGLQNNHHAFPGSYRHAVVWWEPDLSGWVLTLLGKGRVVRDLHQPTKKRIAERRARAAWIREQARLGKATAPAEPAGDDSAWVAT